MFIQLYKCHDISFCSIPYAKQWFLHCYYIKKTKPIIRFLSPCMGHSHSKQIMWCQVITSMIVLIHSSFLINNNLFVVKKVRLCQWHLRAFNFFRQFSIFPSSWCRVLNNVVIKSERKRKRKKIVFNSRLWNWTRHPFLNMRCTECMEQRPDQFSRSSALSSTNRRNIIVTQKMRRLLKHPNLMIFYDGTIQTVTLPTLL